MNYRRRIFSRLFPLIALIIIIIIVISQYYGTIKSAYHPIVTFILKERPEVIPFIGLLAVIGTGWGVYRTERIHNRNRSLKTLQLAIQDFIQATEIGVIYFAYINGRKEIKFRNVVYDTTIYETIVHSGLFTYFPREVQIPLMKLYTRVRIHNEYLKHRIELVETFSLYGSPSKNAVLSQVAVSLESYLTEINNDMESLIEFIQLEVSKKWWEKLISFFY